MRTIFADPFDQLNNPRQPEHNIDPILVNRWSPRNFRPLVLPDGIIDSLFEAARWTPSTYNEQPWLFVYAARQDGQLWQDCLNMLVDANQLWAQQASFVAFMFAKRRFALDNSTNRLHFFDCGAAWMALTLQARKMGLYTHGMGGIHIEESYKTFNVDPKDYEVICAFAVGQLGPIDELPVAERPKPNGRRSINEFVFRGKKS